ncbi:pentatricopeptide repeat domain-containing protein [Spizellomyces punctatus DAOM BR117]|uniref:Pentatricopeptide repeat domain-containing protein n=1 Tax=Spizellomyces punctatus (strain DAOM BR117) TaxID=645134 RepID=A0A0L0H6E2_SPIPD|nr:pentatricopeptide repeat domain-containing protein [Spizellomyces punctatus DAOM BR117]KNC96288.1 pentatricopeptide repeat domain-containing protein [Spizellomyces punctatus DAOM BR117]|eukprot:XP_016604328.1 pentatricopeptide repeat domain-containing protein [Spizellomyces punctatus DAOM BR117]
MHVEISPTEIMHCCRHARVAFSPGSPFHHLIGDVAGLWTVRRPFGVASCLRRHLDPPVFSFAKWTDNAPDNSNLIIRILNSRDKERKSSKSRRSKSEEHPKHLLRALEGVIRARDQAEFNTLWMDVKSLLKDHEKLDKWISKISLVNWVEFLGGVFNRPELELEAKVGNLTVLVRAMARYYPSSLLDVLVFQALWGSRVDGHSMADDPSAAARFLAIWEYTKNIVGDSSPKPTNAPITLRAADLKGLDTALQSVFRNAARIKYLPEYTPSIVEACWQMFDRLWTELEVIRPLLTPAADYKALLIVLQRHSNVNYVRKVVSRMRMVAPLSTFEYNALLKVEGRTGNVSSLVSIWQEMKAGGAHSAPNSASLETVAQGLRAAMVQLLRADDVEPENLEAVWNAFQVLWNDIGDVLDSDHYKQLLALVKRRPVDGDMQIVRVRWVLDRMRETGIDTRIHEQVLLKSGDSPDPKIILQIWKEMQATGTQLDKDASKRVLFAYTQTGDYAGFLSLANSLQREGVTLEGWALSPAFNNALRWFGKRRKLTEFTEVITLMQSLGVKPTSHTLDVTIAFYAKEGFLQKAEEICFTERNDDVSPSIVGYTSLLAAYFKHNESERARNLLEELKTRQIQFDVVTYGSIIHGYTKMKDMDSAEEWVRAMAKTGHEPNEIVYGHIINGYLNAGNPEKARQILHMMKENGIVQPGHMCYAPLVNYYLKAGQWENAEELKLEMSNLPSVHTRYHSIYRPYIQHHLDCDEVASADKLVDELQGAGIPLDERVYGLYITYFARRLDYAQALQWLHRAEQASEASYPCYSSLLNSYARRGRVDDAEALFERMMANGVQPNAGTFAIMMRAHGRAGNPQKAVLIWEQLRTLKVALDGRIVGHFLSLCKESGLMDFARLEWHVLRESVTLNASHYKIYIEGLLLSGMLDEVKRVLVDDMRSENIVLSEDLWTNVFRAMKAADRHQDMQDLKAYKSYLSQRDESDRRKIMYLDD